MEIKIRSKNEIKEILEEANKEKNLIKIEKMRIKENDNKEDNFENIIKNIIIEFENGLLTKLNSYKDNENQNALEKQTNEILNNFKTKAKVIIDNNLTKSYEENAIPILENYFIVLYQKISIIIYNGILYYNNNINKHLKFGNENNFEIFF